MMNAGDNIIIGEKRHAEDCQEKKRKRVKQITKTIPITLEKCSSRLDDRSLLEYLPKERIEALLKSDKLALEWEKPTYVQKFAKQNVWF